MIPGNRWLSEATYAVLLDEQSQDPRLNAWIGQEISKIGGNILEGLTISDKAQEILKELADLKREKEGQGKYDRGNAILSIIYAIFLLFLLNFYSFKLHLYYLIMHESKTIIIFILNLSTFILLLRLFFYIFNLCI
jgi:hypothetical protein